jgi:P4 family phage/plasmid primase-like protien
LTVEGRNSPENREGYKPNVKFSLDDEYYFVYCHYEGDTFRQTAGNFLTLWSRFSQQIFQRTPNIPADELGSIKEQFRQFYDANREQIERFSEIIYKQQNVERLQRKQSLIERLLDPREQTAQNITELLLLQYNFATMRDTEELYIYSEGLYKRNGQTWVNTFVDEITKGKGTKRLISEIIAKICARTYRERNEFDAFPELINLKNGIYDRNQKKLIPHSPDFLFLSQIPRIFDPKTKCPNFLRYLKDCQPDKEIRIELLQAIATCLDRTPKKRKSYMFIGEADTGKSTFLNVLRKFLGNENVCSVSLQQLSGEDRFASAELYAKLACIYSDIENVALETTGEYKILTGSDLIPAQRKYGQPFTFVPYAKLFFSANKLPEVVESADLAFFSRWFVVNWSVQFVDEIEKPGQKLKDLSLEAKLTTESELSGLLNLVLYYLEVIDANDGWLFNQPSAEQIQAVWKMKTDINFEFLKESTVLMPEAITIKAQMYNSYRKSCYKKHYAPESEKAFTETLRREYGHKVNESRIIIDGKRHWTWKGIALKDALAMTDNNLDGTLFVTAVTNSSPSPMSNMSLYPVQNSRQKYRGYQQKRVTSMPCHLSDKSLMAFAKWQYYGEQRQYD